MEQEGMGLMEGPLSLEVRVYRIPPKSMGKKRSADAIEKKRGIVTKPDLDNYIKLVSDAINGVVFADDSQIVAIRASKRYSDVPGIEITVAGEEE